MNIKQAQELSGVSRENIRFYEREGLIRPARNSENDYRDYSAADIRQLKIIRMLRMLDMPLERIGQVLAGDLSLADAAKEQQLSLKARAERLEQAILLCQQLFACEDAGRIDVDQYLTDMDAAPKAGYFSRWVEDYRQAAAYEHRRVFTFTPETAITTPEEFTQALLAFGKDTGRDVEITREGMYPEFTLDGVAYTAWRDYHTVCRCPVATVHCEICDVADIAPQPLSRRQKFLRIVLAALPGVILFVLFLLYWLPNVSGWQDIYLIFVIGFLCAFASYRFWRFHYNDQTPK